MKPIKRKHYENTIYHLRCSSEHPLCTGTWYDGWRNLGSLWRDPILVNQNYRAHICDRGCGITFHHGFSEHAVCTIRRATKNCGDRFFTPPTRRSTFEKSRFEIIRHKYPLTKSGGLLPTPGITWELNQLFKSCEYITLVRPSYNSQKHTIWH